jgi:hypothetical protein
MLKQANANNINIASSFGIELIKGCISLAVVHEECRIVFPDLQPILEVRTISAGSEKKSRDGTYIITGVSTKSSATAS